VLLSAVVGLAIAATLYVLLRALRAPWTIAVPLALVGFDAMMPLTTPRPWLFSMLFFLIELVAIVSVMEREALRVARPEPVDQPPRFALRRSAEALAKAERRARSGQAPV
jgi:hypothetical protein